MKVEKVLEKLEKLFREWELNINDWVLFAQYASKLQGYKVKVRKNHFNVKLNVNKIWWKTSGREAFPPPGSKEFKQFNKLMKETKCDFDLNPESYTKAKKRSREDFIIYSLPNGNKIRVATAVGRLKELDVILNQCKKGLLSKEKAIYDLGLVKELKAASLIKKDLKAISLANKLIKKYRYLESEEKNIIVDYSKSKILKGISIYKGRVKGKIRIILDELKTPQLKQGEVLVADKLSARFISVINRAKAIITDQGGVLSHTAIIAREFKIPCVIGAKIATKILKNGDVVEVNANKGLIKILK